MPEDSEKYTACSQNFKFFGEKTHIARELKIVITRSIGAEDDDIVYCLGLI